VPAEVVSAVASAYDRLCNRTQEIGCFVAACSCGTVEDAAETSFAGMY